MLNERNADAIVLHLELNLPVPISDKPMEHITIILSIIESIELRRIHTILNILNIRDEYVMMFYGTLIKTPLEEPFFRKKSQCCDLYIFG